MYKPSELHSFLSQLGISPKKSLSQNFLVDGNVLRKIVKTAGVGPDDVVLEIGSGPGALTAILLETGARVIAVEKDEVLGRALKRLDSSDHRLSVYCADILKFDFDLLQAFLPEGKKAKVIANLPYHITTPILTYLVSRHDLFSHLVLMVQDEVARRFTAKAGTSEYGSITVFLNYHASPHYAFKVSSSCFYPKPKVESAIVALELHTPPQVENEENFFIMTRTAFQHRRKMLRGSLKDLYVPEDIMNALSTMGLNPLARPEELSLENWVELHKRLSR